MTGMGTPPVSGRGSLRGRLFCVLPALGVLVVQLGGSAAVDRHQTGHPHLNAFGWLLLVIGPALVYCEVGLDIMWTGIVAGTISYAVHRLRGARA